MNEITFNCEHGPVRLKGVYDVISCCSNWEIYYTSGGGGAVVEIPKHEIDEHTIDLLKDAAKRYTGDD